MTMLYVPVSLVNGNFRYIVTMVLSWSFSMTTSYMLWYGLQSFVNASIRFHVLKKCKIVAFLINLNNQVNNKQTVLSYTQQLRKFITGESQVDFYYLDTLFSHFWFFPVCVDSVNVKADKLHSTAISYWGQLDDSVKWDLEIGQVF